MADPSLPNYQRTCQVRTTQSMWLNNLTLQQTLVGMCSQSFYAADPSDRTSPSSTMFLRRTKPRSNLSHVVNSRKCPLTEPSSMNMATVVASPRHTCNVCHVLWQASVVRSHLAIRGWCFDARTRQSEDQEQNWRCIVCSSFNLKRSSD